MREIRQVNNTQIIVLGAVVIVALPLIYFGIVKPIFNKLGITKDKAERQGEKAKNKLIKADYFNPLLYNNNKSRAYLTEEEASSLAYKIYNAKGYIYDDESVAVSSVKKTNNLVDVSLLAKEFQELYNKDLQTYLVSFLELDNYTTIENHINQLRKF
jgi:hypothetical protein|tara:strand:+ start:9089 stop:9559 length:471 start_codon:yes stop_codon:yes gene_type:complete